MKKHCHKEQGVALVVTIIVVAMLAVIGVALMQSVSADRASSRSVTNYMNARLAAEAGLADAMSRMKQAMTNFGYVSGGEATGGGTYRTYVRPRSVTNGSWQFSANTNTYLDSGTNGTTTTLLVSGTNIATGVTSVAVSYTNFFTNTNAQITNRYAFWVDEAGAKQNLSWWGGEAARNLITNVSDIPLVQPTANGQSVSTMPTNVPSALGSYRTYSTITTNLFGFGTNNIRTVVNALLTPATFNLLAPELQGVASRYFFALANPSTAATPLGGKKLNLKHLADHVNTLSAGQGSGNPKAKLVDDLLRATPTNQISWGGGSLSWLTNSDYSESEQKQIVANLIDYLDDDIFPTTDNVDNPTYFGVEMKVDSSGLVVGHPVINFASAGVIFNRNTNGEVNSTRIVCSLGVVYPWSAASSAEDYTPEITLAIEGDVINGVPGMASGSGAAPNYFRSSTLDEQINVHPAPTFSARTGYNWPQSTGLAGNASYSSAYYGHSTGDWPDRGPVNMTFANLKYVFSKLRLHYKSTDGDEGYVQILPSNLSITNSPSTVVAGGGAGSLLVKFTESLYTNTANLYLAGDPRAHFKTSTWTNLPSRASFGTNIPIPAAGIAAVVLTNGVSTNTWDEEQGLTMNFNWYTSARITNHLNRPTNTFQSIGELGYLWTGKPWQTLNMTRTNMANPLKADWNLLDYVSGGYPDGSGSGYFTTMPYLLPSGTNANFTASNSLVQDGGFNILTRKLATVSAFLTNAPALSSNSVNTFLSSASPQFASVGGALAEMKNLSGATNYKFVSEAFTRAAANAAVVQSRIFTVYSKGEYINGALSSSVLLEAEVFVDVDPNTGAPLLRVISKKFL